MVEKLGRNWEKIRKNAQVTVYDNQGFIVETVIRNVYSKYISNANPVVIRYMGKLYNINQSWGIDNNEVLSIQLKGIHPGAYIKRVIK